MARIDRQSFDDAKMITGIFLPQADVRTEVLGFLADSIDYAHGVSNSNWNLNLDKDSDFIRLNVGRCYALEIRKSMDYLLVLCRRDRLKTVPGLIYCGYDNQGRLIVSSNIDEVPDALVTIPQSVGCRVEYSSMRRYLPQLVRAHRAYLRNALTTTLISPIMRNAHSPGMVDYLSDYLGRPVPNPVYVISENDYQSTEATEAKEARKLSDQDLESKLTRSRQGKPMTVEVPSTRYYRNPYVAEYAHRRANGFCQDCGNPAPFIAKGSQMPYLEIHHIKPLADGGEDSVENTVALCPNCHRKRHYG
jgi:5-methylcytosine-specific restriction endonuclease McrA